MERISEAEAAVMMVLWSRSPLTAQDVIDAAPPERNWVGEHRQDLTRAPRRQEGRGA